MYKKTASQLKCDAKVAVRIIGQKKRKCFYVFMFILF